jgi:hypothetical protein
MRHNRLARTAPLMALHAACMTHFVPLFFLSCVPSVLLGLDMLDSNRSGYRSTLTTLTSAAPNSCATFLQTLLITFARQIYVGHNRIAKEKVHGATRRP